MVATTTKPPKRAIGRKRKKKHPATYRLTPEALGMLSTLSTTRGISMASIVELSVREHCAKPVSGHWDPSEKKNPATYRLTPEALVMIRDLSVKKKIPRSAIVETAVRRYHTQYC